MSLKNPLGVGIAVAGAAILLISIFLPLNESVMRIESNTLIQRGGWAIAFGAVSIAVTAAKYDQTAKQAWFMPFIVVITLFLLAMQTHEAMNLTFYPIGDNGKPDSSMPGVSAPLGIAVYVAALGLFISASGMYNLWYTKQQLSKASDQAQ